MPIYEYRCEKGHQFEVLQKMADDPITACEECGAPVERVFHPVAVHFKGSGFYTTDYGSGKAASTSGNGDSGSSEGGSSEGGEKKSGDSKESKKGSGDSKKSESKSDSKSSSKSSD